MNRILKDDLANEEELKNDLGDIEDPTLARLVKNIGAIADQAANQAPARNHVFAPPTPVTGEVTPPEPTPASRLGGPDDEAYQPDSTGPAPHTANDGMLSPAFKQSVVARAGPGIDWSLSAPKTEAQSGPSKAQQAFYAAGTNTVLPASFFTPEPKNKLADQETLAKFKSDLVKKVAPKPAKPEPNPDAWRTALANTPYGKNLKTSIGDQAFNRIMPADIPFLKDAFTATTAGTAEEGKNERQQGQFAHGGEEQSNKAAFTADQNDLNRKNAMDIAKLRLAHKAGVNPAEQRRQDEETRKWLQGLTKQDKDLVGNFASLSGLQDQIDANGGIDQMGGVGVFEGAEPSTPLSPELQEFRQRYKLLTDQLRHSLYGSVLTPTEKAEWDQAIKGIQFGNAPSQIQNSLNILRDKLKYGANQALVGAPKYALDRLPEMFSGDVLGDARKKAMAGAAPAPNPAAPTTPPIPTTPSGKPYARKQVSKSSKRTRYLDANGNVIEEVDGIH